MKSKATRSNVTVCEPKDLKIRMLSTYIRLERGRAEFAYNSPAEGVKQNGHQ